MTSARPAAAAVADETAPRVTVVVVPRERFSVSLRSLASLYENTDEPFRLVYIDGNSPRAVRDALRAQAGKRGFDLVRTERYLSPNQARNLALQRVHTPYVVFVDNDVFFTPGWLSSLVACADETGAWVVGPLPFEGDAAEQRIHNAGGFCRFEGEGKERDLVQETPFKRMHANDLPLDAGRQRYDYVEFHCVLVRRAAFDVIGPLDEALLSTREHLDLCLQVGSAGGEVWAETSSRVTYDNPPPVARGDLPFFLLRWSDAWNEASLRHFAAKYGLGERYLARSIRSRARRRAIFEPVRRVVRQRLGTRSEQVVDFLLGRVERVLNVVVIGPIARSLAPPRRR